MAHVIVLGLGIAGSAAAAEIAARGHKVTALEQFQPLHERGSSHGDTRIYRRVPFEGPQYYPLASESLDGWRAWGKLAGEDLLVTCGGIHAGPPGADGVRRCATLCREMGQPFEMIDGAEVNRRYPQYALPAGWEVAYQPNAGFARPDATRLFLHARARAAGADLRFGVAVGGIEPTAAGVIVQAGGERILADRVVVTAGAWAGRLFPSLPLGLEPVRRVIAWFDPHTPANLADGRMPIFIFNADGGWYGMPTPDGRLKLGHAQHFGEIVDPTIGAAPPADADRDLLSQCVAKYFAGFNTTPSAMKQCIYTNTPDKNFTIDRHPDDSRIAILACCSGHGFKYAPAYGTIAADLAEDHPRPDLAPFAIARSMAVAARE